MSGEIKGRPQRVKAQATYGELLVLAPAEDLPDGKKVWRCRCSCGRESDVRAAYLTSGRARVCQACVAEQRDAKMIGKTFGTWLVLRKPERHEIPPEKARIAMSRLWRCKCVHCGVEVVRSRQNLMEYHQQCPCKTGDAGKPRPFQQRRIDPAKVRINGLTREYKCCECGKRFETGWTGDWGYKIGDKKYCSYPCMRKADKKRLIDKRRRATREE